MVIELDLKDRRILSDLDMDARQPLSQLGKKVGLSREVVNYRIAQLEKSKVILGYYAVLDTAKLGLIYCRIFLKYRGMTLQKEQELLDFCSKHKDIAWIVISEGKWELALVVLAESLRVIEAVRDELGNRFGQYFQDPYISIALSITEFKHNYLYKTPDYREIVVGASGQMVSLDDMDWKILSAIVDDSRMALVEIAKAVGTNPKTVDYRLKRLINDKAILAFRTMINTRLLGYDHYKVFLTLQEAGNAASEIREFLLKDPKVIYITKPLGMHTLEFEAIVKNTSELHGMMMEFRQRFPEELVGYDVYFLYEFRSLRYLPATRSV